MSRLKVALLSWRLRRGPACRRACGHPSHAATADSRRSPRLRPAVPVAAWRVYCYGCHAAPNAPGGVNLLALDESDLGKDPVVWEKVLRKLRMRRDAACRRGAARRGHLRRAGLVHRERARALGRAQSQSRPRRRSIASTARNTRTRCATCLALEIDATELLPADDIGYGFDNIGDVLTVSPLLLERYLSAASKISRAASRRHRDARAVPDLRRVRADSLRSTA